MPTASPAPRVFCFLLAAGVFLLDQASKGLVTRALEPGETRRLIPGLFNLTHLRNPGAAFGLLADFDSRWVGVFLMAFSVVALALAMIWLWRGAGPMAGLGLGLILGGALGNLFDRLRAGSVVDFLDVHLGAYHWPAFNLADSAIVLGAAGLVVEALRRRGGASREA